MSDVSFYTIGFGQVHCTKYFILSWVIEGVFWVSVHDRHCLCQCRSHILPQPHTGCQPRHRISEIGHLIRLLMIISALISAGFVWSSAVVYGMVTPFLKQIFSPLVGRWNSFFKIQYSFVHTVISGSHILLSQQTYYATQWKYSLSKSMIYQFWAGP